LILGKKDKIVKEKKIDKIIKQELKINKKEDLAEIYSSKSKTFHTPESFKNTNAVSV